MHHNILILSNNALSSFRNNGKTLVSLFSNLEGSTLSQLYLREEVPDVSLPCRYFKISERDILKSFFVDSGQEIFSDTGERKKGGCQFGKKKSIFSRLSDFRDFAFAKCLRDFVWACGLFRNRRLGKWLDSVRPHVVFFVAGGGIFSYRLVLKLAREREIPVIVYFTDDYLIYPCGGFFPRLYQAGLRSIARKVVNHASFCFAIGESMANEYRELFGKEFSWIMNCSMFDGLAPVSFSKNVLQISYFGGLHFQRWEALSKLGRILKRLKKRGLLSRLNVYSASVITEEMREAFLDSEICFKGGVFGKDLNREVEVADVLVHVESDDPEVLQNTRLSVSTKIPEYLSSGRLVLGFGPLNVASLALLKKYSLGVVVDSSTSEDWIEEQLCQLWNRDVFEASLRSAREFRKTTLNVDGMRKRLLRAIENA